MRLKIKRMGYYWPTMVRYCMDYSKRCHQCQIHDNFIHQHLNRLYPTVASWPFERWRTNIIGPIELPSSKGHMFILKATDYFLKWSEAIPPIEVTTNNVVKFFKEHVVYRFGSPRAIGSDNGPSFKSFKVGRFAYHHKLE